MTQHPVKLSTLCSQSISIYGTSFFKYKHFFQGFLLPDDYSSELHPPKQQHSQDPVLKTVYCWLSHNTTKPIFLTPQITGTFSQLFIDDTPILSAFIRKKQDISATPLDLNTNIPQSTLNIHLPFRLYKTTLSKLHDHCHTCLKITYNNFSQYYYSPLLTNGF